MEKRAFSRTAITLPVELKIKDSPSRISSIIKGKTVNLSEGGLNFFLDRPLPLSQELIIRIDISPKHPPLEAQIQLVWNKSIDNRTMYYGVQFLKLRKDFSLILREILEEDKIVTASYLPEKIISNEDIIKMGFKGSPAVLERLLGVKERRAIAEGETNADMLTKVAKKILDKAGILPKELDRIICAADPGDSAAPDTACAVQAKIGATCPAFGISMSCTGWLAAMNVALSSLGQGEKNILVLASSITGSMLYYYNLMHRAIFGDGAGGVLLQSHHRDRFLASNLWTKGEYYSKIFVPYPWSKIQEGIPLEYRNSFYMSNDQKMFFNELDSSLIPFTKCLLNKAKVKMEDVDIFLLHYPAKPLFEHSIKLLRIPYTKTFSTFAYYGNLVAAGIPVLLDTAIQKGRIEKGDLVCMLGYGAGFTGGGLIMKY